jgi:hypothetical protein
LLIDITFLFGAGEVDIAVHRAGEDVVVVLENQGSAVSLMDIEVEDEYFLGKSEMLEDTGSGGRLEEVRRNLGGRQLVSPSGNAQRVL